MEPEIRFPPQEELQAEAALPPIVGVPATKVRKFRRLHWMFIGGQGVRAGWSVLAFLTLYLISVCVLGYSFFRLHLISRNWMTDLASSPSASFFIELALFLSVVGAASLVAYVERRNLLAYNLTGPWRIPRFLSGLAAGFVSLSLLVGALAWGGWLHFGPAALSGAAIFRFGALWACVFVLVGCVEEGLFRCFLLSTLTRGINFWWALGTVGALCLVPLVTGKGNGAWGVYGFALLGLTPCLILHIRKTPRSGFWQAAWATSTLFGFAHIFNPGETWVGISQVVLIGFVFCVSVRLTGSAWWAIGCHAAWDWAQSFFYGTADSGHAASGHYLTTSPAGNALWSGGADGPEGSLLVLAVVLLLLVWLLAMYGRKKSALPFAEEAAR
ncbi:MAG: CPBP family intramembrane glutamic endopeptidase [Terracidiphilus sp.]|jgi:hypothetical protein